MTLGRIVFKSLRQHALSTMVINGTQVKIYAWYDNEMGYSTKVVELIQYMDSVK